MDGENNGKNIFQIFDEETREILPGICLRFMDVINEVTDKYGKYTSNREIMKEIIEITLKLKKTDEKIPFMAHGEHELLLIYAKNKLNNRLFNTVTKKLLLKTNLFSCIFMFFLCSLSLYNNKKSK